MINWYSWSWSAASFFVYLKWSSVTKEKITSRNYLMNFFVSVSFFIWVRLSFHTQWLPKLTRNLNFKGCISMGYSQTFNHSIFICMIWLERSLPLMWYCRQALKEKHFLLIWYMVCGVMWYSQAAFLVLIFSPPLDLSLVTNKIFSVILFAYMEGLVANKNKNKSKQFRQSGPNVSWLFFRFFWKNL